MGLLTDPNTQATISTFIIRFHKPASILCYVAAITYMVALAHPNLNAGTYFSENALLPGLVEREYSESSHSIDQQAEAYKKAVDENNDGIPVQYLMSRFTQLGLDTYSQNFTMNHPFLDRFENERQPRVVQGTNVYGILRAPRIAGTEAIVVMVPYRNDRDGEIHGHTHYGIGLMMSLARFFLRKTYWSKDIIFLVVDQEDVGIQAWLEAYQGIPSCYITSSIMQGRSGTIMGAFNLEIGVSRVRRVDLVTEGINGHLPNLDLINLVVRLCGKEGLTVSFQNQVDTSSYHRTTRDGFQKSARTMLLNMAHQAAGRPRGIHGLFLQYHIEAITIRAHAAQGNSGKSMQNVGRLLEGIIRSINNLLERLHQSFFFYVLPNLDRYVSIGLYMPPFGLLMMVPVLNGLALWIQSSRIPVQADEATTEETTDDNFIPRTFNKIIPLLIGASSAGALLYISPEFFTERFSSFFKVTPQEAVIFCVLALFIAGMMMPYMIGRRMPPPADRNQATAEWQLLKSIALIWQAVILSAISMINFSLAFFVGVAVVPISAIVRPTSRKLLRVANALLLLIISPPVLLFIFLFVYGLVTTSDPDVIDVLVTSIQALRHTLYTAIVDGYLFGNWSYGLATLVLYPNWLMLWLVIWN